MLKTKNSEYKEKNVGGTFAFPRKQYRNFTKTFEKNVEISANSMFLIEEPEFREGGDFFWKI